MEKQFVPYELALKLKELGFNEPCIMCYRNRTIYGSSETSGYSDNWYFKTNDNMNNYLVNSNNSNYWITAPLWQQAFDWCLNKLEKYSINYWEDWSGSIKHIDDEILGGIIFQSKEECLNKLIELVENEIKNKV